MAQVKVALGESLKKLMREKPFSAITVDAICRGAQTSHRNFYRHFKDKYDLLNWVYQTDFLQYITVDLTKPIWGYLSDICGHLHSDRKFYLNAFAVSGQNSFREFCMQRLTPRLMLDFGAAFDDEKLAQFCLRHITDAVFDHFQIWLSQEPCTPPDEYAKRMTAFVTALARNIYLMGKAYIEKTEGA